MYNIKISDITLCQSGPADSAKLTFKEKLETAKLLEKLGVDIVEASYNDDSPADGAFLRTLAATLESTTLSIPVSPGKEKIDSVWAAVSKAKKPRLNFVIPTSTVGMEYQHQLKAESALPVIEETVKYCASLCGDVEFTAEDAVRSEPDFLAKVIKTAIAAGAKTITLCDCVGEVLPDEMSQFIKTVCDNVPELGTVTLSLKCKDELGLASACALVAIAAGVQTIKVSCAGCNTLSLENFLNVIKIRGETLNIKCNINTTSLKRIFSQLASLAGKADSPRKAPVSEVGSRDNGDSVLPEIADINSLRGHIESLGYEISQDDLERIFVQYNDISKGKKVVNCDIEALIAETAGQAPPTYQLKNFVVNSGSAIASTAYIDIVKDGTIRSALAAGDGPIDAALRATEQIIGANYELEEFQINAVTGGREATGDAIVRIRHGGKLYSGRGVSTDIVAASIRAYISAVNKIVHED